MHLIADLEQEETINPRLLFPRPTPQPPCVRAANGMAIPLGSRTKAFPELNFAAISTIGHKRPFADNDRVEKGLGCASWSLYLDACPRK